MQLVSIKRNRTMCVPFVTLSLRRTLDALRRARPGWRAWTRTGHDGAAVLEVRQLGVHAVAQ